MKEPATAIQELQQKAAADATRVKRRTMLYFDGMQQAESPRSLPGARYAAEAPKAKEEPRTLAKSLSEAMDASEVGRLAFEVNPDQTTYNSIYIPKPRLIPEWLAKRISHTDDLVAAIVLTRKTQMRAFGEPRADRHSTGFEIAPKEGVLEKLNDEQKRQLDERIERAVELLTTCGSNEGIPKNKQMTFGDFLDMLTQNAIIVGKVAVEKVRDRAGRVHSFRPVDAGTIFPAAVQQTAGESIRRHAISLLARLQRKEASQLAKELDLQKWAKDEYSWVQAIDGTPKMVFTDDQMIVRNFYPCPDVEMMGHPVTPLDTVVTQVTTHFNITTHSKVYFQSGRAAKGMLVIQSDEADAETVKYMQAHFQANINSASNAWRLPVFAIGKDDTITWEPIDQAGSRDAEFQYLGDQVARAILSAFLMSPEELPGWAYLSKGTNAQTLSENSNEYMLEAHRDLGIRPLIKHFEELVNSELLPIVDEGLAKICRFRMLGLDTESAEKESNRLAEDAPLHMTLNEINEKVEKEPLPPQLGGNVVLNPQFHALILSKYVTVGYVREHLLGYPNASKDPRYDYIPDPSYFNQAQLIQASQQAQQQAMMQQQQLAAQAQQPGGTSTANAPGAEHPAAPGQGDTAPREQAGADDLQRSLDEAIKTLGKGEDGLVDLAKAEAHMTPAQKRMMRKHREVVSGFRRGFEEDVNRAKREILSSVEDLLRDVEG